MCGSSAWSICWPGGRRDLAPAGSRVAATNLVKILVAAKGQGSIVIPLKGSRAHVLLCCARGAFDAALLEVSSINDDKALLL